ncbi:MULTISPECIES: efflux RND transporter periplasmic adaptor subunit [unclassified Mucilaginibacter]|uniref:efflux RND transporter periplasmic adaptor subunit n=1 Tax=unclassified Mucilaginibacter TaxID=2617802 RepID=UPI002AC9D4DB|nr:MULTISPECIES: efflux RND transporter periplasmic adaptor subunit [unclassified Mucilaginibacter]MEB0262824.1 efflux RND transporter periplasmic adaptor subunit [Mucilaginibacter sp. 10I4]MEB0277663.1 efflux RND transporter periplasmic adaptor subunit [Mucilaginibacter sp. 10B2]MEB0299578.1 efflux RND transporter periplasmic adaptor subunit [Mucilaginibacter sp. 5C4]WPX24709.1 efflux RND transporter periplasmic adaptor subunit [Mucilaginibacter sp. 5C4]
MLKFKGMMHLFGAATAILYFGCTSTAHDTSAQENPIKLPVITLNSRDTVISSDYVADIQAIKNIEIRTRVRGFLEKIYIDEGMSVKKGQLLFKLNDEEFKTMLSKANAALSNAVADAKATALEVDRVTMLVNKNVISKSELEVAKAKLHADKATIEEAQSAVENARNHIAYTSIHAPFDGIINRIPLKAGSLIDEGMLLTHLSDISSVYAYFSFPENEYLQYERTKNIAKNKGSDKVKLVLSDGSKYQYTGDIETVEGEIEQSTGSINFRARFPNPKKLLRHGATGKIFLTHKADSVILVPQQAVFDIQDKSYVYIVDLKNKLHMRAFTPLMRLSHSYIVKAGLNSGDRILYEGIQNAHDGMVIQPQPLKEPLFAMKK